MTGLTLKTVGTQTVTSVDVANSLIRGTASTWVTPGPARSVDLSGMPSGVQAGAQVSVRVTSFDGYGNVKNNALGGSVTFASSDPQAVLPPVYQFVAGDYGRHTFTVELRTAGAQTLSVTVGSYSDSVDVSISPADTAKLAVSGGPSPWTAGTSGLLTVAAKDAFGNLTSGYHGTVHLTSSDAIAVLPANYGLVPADHGAHAFSVTLKTAGTQSVTATDTVTASITGSRTGVVVTAAPAATLSAGGLSSPRSAGTAGSLVVMARDAYGNTAGGYRGTVHLSSTDAAATLPADYTFLPADGGSRTFGVTLRTAGTQSVTATDTATASLSATQAGILVTATSPGAPIGVTATAGNAQAQVTWTAPASDGGSPITGYTVTSTSGGRTCTATAPALTCTVTGLLNGTPYTFTVTATNGIGTGPASAASAPVTPRTTPGAPTDVTVVGGTQRATVSWTAPGSNGGSAITGYTVISAPGGKTCTPTPPTGTACVVTDLANGMPYTFSVTATNAAGTGPASAASVPMTLTPTVVACTPGTAGGSVAAVTGSTIACEATLGSGASFMGWTASGLTPATSGSAAQSFIAGAPGTGSIVAAYTDDLGSHGVTFGYTISPAPTVPGAPTAVSATAGNAQASVQWSAPASDGGSPITGYTVTSAPGGRTCSPTPATGTNCTVTGLTNGTPYTFSVTARNGVGTGPASAASAPVTPVAPAVVRRPDGRIRLGTSGAYVGNNVYNATGSGQSRTGAAKRGKTITFGISIQNDGTSADSFKVRATGSATSRYTLKYLHGSTDITARVVAGTFRTSSLAPGAAYAITVKVTVKSTATAGSKVTRLVTITSVGSTSKKDVVSFIAKRS